MSNLFANWAINCGIKKIKSSSSLEISYQFRERRYVGVHMRVLWKSAGHLLAFQRAKNNWNVKFFYHIISVQKKILNWKETICLLLDRSAHPPPAKKLM